jgi:hypothetical protein
MSVVVVIVPTALDHPTTPARPFTGRTSIDMLRDSKVINFGLVVLVRLLHHPPVLGKAWLALFTHHIIAFHMEL